MKKNSLLFTGILTSSLVIGFLTGLSASPVFGIALTALAGLIGTIITLIINKRMKISGQSLSPFISKNSKLIGLTLTCTSLLFVGGIFLGSELRWKNEAFAHDKEFPWTEKTKPSNGFEAIDWINVRDLLEARGYSSSQVKYLYELSRKDSIAEDYLKYDEQRNYYSNILMSGGGLLPNPEARIRMQLRCPVFY